MKSSYGSGGKYRGTNLDNRDGRWYARYKRQALGGFRTETEAAQAYANAAGMGAPVLRKPLAGDEHPLWKGERSGYLAHHSWIRYKLGKAKFCVCCAVKNLPRYEWANVSGNYKRDINDWKSLCTACHRRFDTKCASRFRGVSPSPYDGKPWSARIFWKGKTHTLGYFSSEEDAALAHDVAYQILFNKPGVCPNSI